MPNTVGGPQAVSKKGTINKREKVKNFINERWLVNIKQKST
jgi:hypothetical protein